MGNGSTASVSQLCKEFRQRGSGTVKSRHWLAVALGLLAVVLAVWQILAAGQTLEITTLRSTDPPITIVTPQDEPDGTRPLVLVAHGFAGSSVVMRGFALTLVHAGYAVVLWDFDGNGINPRPLASSALGDALITQ